MSARSGRPPRRGPATKSWDPLRELVALKDRLNRLLESVQGRGGLSSDDVAGWIPPVDVREDREGFVLTAEVPGVRREDLQIKVEGAIVTVKGRREREQGARSALRIERPCGSFSRTFSLPAPVAGDRVDARVHLGVLEVFLPRSTATRARSIKVQEPEW